MGKQPDVTPDHLSLFLDTKMRRQILTSHLVCLFENEPKTLEPINVEGDVIDKAARQYLNLLEWTESSAASILALHQGISVATVHNRLRIARERGILEKPGAGKRTL